MIQLLMLLLCSGIVISAILAVRLDSTVGAVVSAGRPADVTGTSPSGAALAWTV